MISKLIRPNSFGRNTYSIDLEKVYKIIFEEDDNGNLIVFNYRRGIFKDKLLYSFTHNSNWEEVIPLTMQKMRNYTNANEQQYFTDEYWKIMTKEYLSYVSKNHF